MQDVHIRNFVEIASKWKHLFRSLVDIYVATRTEKGWALRYAQKILSPDPNLAVTNSVTDFSIETAHLKAGRTVSIVSSTEVDAILKQITSGSVSSRKSDLTFQIDGNKFHAYLDLTRPPHINTLERVPFLQITTGNNENLFNVSMDLELRAADQPFFDVNELFTFLSIPIDLRNAISARHDFALRSPLWISQQSTVRDGKIYVEVMAPPSIEPAEVKLGFKVPTSNGFQRFSVLGNTLNWDDAGIWRAGKYEYALDDAQYAQCFLSYKGEPLYALWLIDQSKSLNYRAGIYDLFDRERTVLRELLYPKKDSQQLEDGVALLLGLHGFAVTKYGFGKLKDGPDLIVDTPIGRTAVIECTTDIPDKGDKLSKLIQRTTRIRTYLSNAGHANKEVLPVLITNLPREETKADLGMLAKHGIALVCRENIENLLERLNLPSNPEQVFDEARSLVPEADQLKR